MKKIVFDTYSFIAFFRQEEGYEFIRDLLVKMANDQSEGFITTVTIGEVYYLISKKGNQKNAETAIDACLHFPIQIVDVDLKLSVEAAKLKTKFSLSYADSFSAALAMNKRATLITGSHEFDDLIGETNFKVKYFQQEVSKIPVKIMFSADQKNLKTRKSHRETIETKKGSKNYES